MSPANEALIESWVLSLHQKRPRTIAAYRQELERFARWWNGDLADVTKRDIQRWITEMQEQGRAPATMRARWVALRSFYAWADDEDEVEQNPMAGIVVSKGHAAPPDVLSEPQVVALLKACEGPTFYDRRDTAMLRLFLATGLRVSEMIGLHLGDLDLPNRIAAVRDGKGGRARVVRFDPATGAALDRYKRVRARHKAASRPELWIGKRGRLSTLGAADLLERRAEQAGIGHVHPHQLRHTWADRYLAGGGKEGDLMQLGGWQNADVMRRYGSARAVDRALAAYDDVDPMRGL